MSVVMPKREAGSSNPVIKPELRAQEFLGKLIGGILISGQCFVQIAYLD